MTAADTYHGQFVTGLWLMALIAAGSAVLAGYLWWSGSRRSPAAGTARSAEDIAARERLVSQTGYMAAVAAVSLASIAIVWWLFGTPADAGIFGRALTVAVGVLAGVVAVSLVVALSLYVAARRRASRSDRSR
ncbi:MAG: hypothetical protein ABJB33_05845 [Gemmatimonadota bacterium]